jgi:hypothetical protein
MSTRRERRKADSMENTVICTTTIAIYMNFMLTLEELLGKPDSNTVKKVSDIPAGDREIKKKNLQCRLRFIKLRFPF